MGIAPISPPWQGGILLLNHTRIDFKIVCPSNVGFVRFRGFEAEGAVGCARFFNWHQVALFIVRAVNAEVINLAAVASVLESTVRFAMDAANFKKDAASPDSTGLALDSVDAGVVFH